MDYNIPVEMIVNYSLKNKNPRPLKIRTEDTKEFIDINEVFFVEKVEFSGLRHVLRYQCLSRIGNRIWTYELIHDASQMTWTLSKIFE
jgi:hypothetical protein